MSQHEQLPAKETPYFQIILNLQHLVGNVEHLFEGLQRYFNVVKAPEVDSPITTQSPPVFYDPSFSDMIMQSVEDKPSEIPHDNLITAQLFEAYEVLQAHFHFLALLQCTRNGSDSVDDELVYSGNSLTIQNFGGTENFLVEAVSQDNVGYDQEVSHEMSDLLHDQMKALFPLESNFTLHRFLIASGMKVERAAETLQAHIDWRQITLPIDITTIPNEIKKGSCVFQGFSKDGFPIIYLRTRYQTPKNRDVGECVRHTIHTVERALGKLGRKADTEMGKVIVVLDRVGETRENVDFELGRQISTIMQRNYPERLHMVLVYPADLLYICIWEVLKFFVDETNRNRFKLLTSQEQLLEYIDKSELLRELGGDAELDLSV